MTVFSAGTEPAGQVNPFAIKVMAEVGIDISSHHPEHVDRYIAEEWDYVITVCDDARETCPVFLGKVRQRLHISFEDPAKAKGTEVFIINEFRRIRNSIKTEFYRYYTEYFKTDKNEKR